jgi:hypothetical protein
MVSELLQKYIWLVNTFVRAGDRGLSLDEICSRWEDRFDSDYPRRTFNNHRQNVEDVFGIKIACNRSTNRYFIEYSDDVADDNEEAAWLINTFTVNNMLSLGKERLSGRIAVEDIPSGHRHLTSVMDAMTEGLELRIEYQKYTSSGSDIYTVRPYAVKEASRRWYLIGYCLERKGLRVYGLDRVKRLDETGNTFRMDRKFSIDELFATSFGIYLPDGPGQTITFRTDETDARYLRDLPVHPSQTEIERCEGSVTFSIFVCPNKALIMEFCKYGSSIEVLSPESVREEVASELDKAARLYK